jgi:hypothetical protein
MLISGLENDIFTESNPNIGKVKHNISNVDDNFTDFELDFANANLKTAIRETNFAIVKLNTAIGKVNFANVNLVTALIE